MKVQREFFRNLKELPRDEWLTPGSPLCAGCGGLAALRLVLKALGGNVVTVNAAGCLDRCELGPCAVIYPEGIWYRLDSREAVDGVIARHIQNQARAPELMIDPLQ